MATQLFQPSATQAGTVDWFNNCVARSAHGDFTETTIVTPGLANVMLSRNPNNRNRSDRKVQEYASDMIAGRWLYNMEPIIFAASGELNDGQHRLQAIIESNSPQKMLIAFGATRESRTTVDQGMARTAGHYLAMQGVDSSKSCASIAGLVMAYETTGGRVLRDRRTHSEIVERVLSDPEIGVSAHFSNTVQKFAKGRLTPSQIGACHYLFSKIDRRDAEEYLTQVCVGERIKRGDPAFAARFALRGITGEQRLERLEAVFRGWVAFRQQRPLKIAKLLGALPALV